MIPIYALEKMDKFTTFEKPFRSNLEILWWARKFDPSKFYVKEMFPFIRRVKPALIAWLRIAALTGYVRYWLLKIIPKPARRWLQRFGFFVDPLAVKNAFEDPALAEFLLSTDQ